MDYVTCVAYASQRKWVASAGLDCCVSFWDVEKALNVNTSTLLLVASIVCWWLQWLYKCIS